MQRKYKNVPHIYMRENKIVPFGDKFSELDHVDVSLVFDFLILQSDVQLAG